MSQALAPGQVSGEPPAMRVGAAKKAPWRTPRRPSNRLVSLLSCRRPQHGQHRRAKRQLGEPRAQCCAPLPAHAAPGWVTPLPKWNTMKKLRRLLPAFACKLLRAYSPLTSTAADASSTASSAPAGFSVRPARTRTSWSICAATSGFCRRNSLAASRPWPNRTSPRL